MKLVGSRALGLNGERSDYDYVAVDLEKCESYEDVVNEKLGEKSHCYHFSKAFLERLARYEAGPHELYYIFNPVNYLAGVIDVNPLDYRDAWISLLKQTDFHQMWFQSQLTKKFKKRFYHVVFNYFALLENTLHISDEHMAVVRRFHDKVATIQEGEDIINLIKNL